MQRRLGVFLILVLCLSIADVSLGAVAKKVKAKVVKKAVLKKAETKKVEKPVLLPKVEVPPALTEEKLQDYKEEVNVGFAKIKEQIDKISGDNSDAKVGGAIFFRWQKYTQNGGSNVNNFDVDRAYIDIKKKLDWDASVRITLDIARLDTTKLDTSKKSQNFFDYLKYAYVEMPISAVSSLYSPLSLSARLGLQHTMWIDWADKILNLRFIAKSLVDNETVMSSADFGIGALGKVSMANMPEVEYHATLQNGSGYKSPETDSRKNAGLRLNSTVYQNDTLGSIIVGGFGNVVGLNSSGTDSSSTKQVGALVAYKHDLGTAYVEYLYGTGIMGYSLGGIYNFYPAFNVFARADHYDPNRSNPNDELDRAFYGIIYDWGKDIRLALDMQTVTGGSAAATSAGKTTSALYLHTLVNI